MDNIDIRIHISDVAVFDGKGYEGKHTAMPFVGCAVSNGRKEIMNWLKGRNPISYF